MLDKVFVYGTLKRGYGNNRLLSRETFLGEAITENSYLLHGRGIPFAIPARHAPAGVDLAPIRGELWSITNHNTLVYLDSLEGYTEGRMNNFYNRVEITTTNGDECYIYEVFNWNYKHYENVCPIINGCYEWRR